MKNRLFDVHFPCDQRELESILSSVSPANSHFLGTVSRSLALHEYAPASQIFEKLADTEPVQRSSFMMLAGFCHFMADDYVRSIRLLSDLVKQNGEDFQLHTLLGIAYHYLGLRGRANTHWWAAHQMDRNEFILALMDRFFSDENHPERLALFPVCRGRGIDVGCGHRKTHPQAIGVDLTPGGEKGKVGNVAGQTCVADIAGSGDHLWMFSDNELDYVVQRHNLEHYKDFLLALQEWKRVLKPGGILGMVVPDEEECDTLRLDSTHYHVFTIRSLQRAIDLIGGFHTCYTGKLLKRWSFVSILQKADPTGSNETAAFDYLRAVRDFEVEQLMVKATQYEATGDQDMVAQCRLFAEQLTENPASASV
jgi:SAM-dependent methyltransferase